MSGILRTIELLAPAKDLQIGIVAINNGADAIYIGAPAFGARKAACNSLKDIEALVRYAHRFYCRVFVTLNTIVYDHELAEVERLIHQLYHIGVDALIIQDMGILKLDLPPVSLHASTQMHNYDIERIKFLDRIGFQRIVLARELSLQQIREIRKQVKAELEVFVHGALCVSLSGQCYFSQHLCGRSANRGECAQPCRMKWTVKDSTEKVIVDNKHVLSLKDLNLSDSIEDLIDAGVDSFKIEGRLKDENYVSNVTNYYSSLISGTQNIKRLGSGRSITAWTPDPERSFNRGYSDYFIHGRKRGMVNMDSPKSVGKLLGKVKHVKGNRLTIEAEDEVHNGDGLCYFDKGELKGIKVNSAEGMTLICNEVLTIPVGSILYRNYDHQFVIRTEKEKTVRKIRIIIEAFAKDGKLALNVTDENGTFAEYETADRFEKATNPQQEERIKQQLEKCGDSDFICDDVRYNGNEILFIPAAAVNAARRCLLERLTEVREANREVVLMNGIDRNVFYTLLSDWHLNIVNRNAAAFYQEHGVEQIEPGFEKNNGLKDKELMHTRYCLLYELGRCRKENKNEDLQFPLYICNDKQQFLLEFDCGECFMKIKK